jgi:threonine/homoserine/homoserine lactone efflux protein
MITLLHGIKWGLFLTVLVGPIVFSLVQAGIEKGTRVGIVMGSGIWISDILFILAVYSGLSAVGLPPDFAFYTGIVGGLILISFGVVNFFVKPKNSEEKIIRASTYGGYFIKGFLINTINPFTVFFWITISTTEVSHLPLHQAILFYSGILGTLVLTDTLKVVLAKSIRKMLTPKSLFILRNVVGVAMVVFGIILMIRVILAPPTLG